MEYQISEKMKGMKPSAIREIFKSLGTPGAISFAAGNPAPESFPVDAMAKISSEIFATTPSLSLQYGITEGYPLLRDLVRERISRKFSAATEQDSVIITSGGQQGIELTCKVLCNEGDTVICENPSFIGALNAFRSLGVTPIGVPLNDDGIDTAALRQALLANPKTKFLYLIPTFHNPAGITSTLENRRAVYALAREFNVLILEDNPYGELRFAGEEVPTYKSMDADGRVIYCGSFSKVLSAGIRIGFLSANNELMQKIVVAKQVEDVHTNQFFQMVCAKYIQDYDLDAHIESIRALYRHKCNLMLQALDTYMPKEVKFTRPEGGLFLWCTLPQGVSLTEFTNRAKEQKVFIVPGIAFNCDQDAPSDSFRLNYSMPSDAEIEKGIKILADLI